MILKKLCSSCTTYMVLFAIFLIISIGISSVFIYLEIKNTNAKTAFYQN